MVRLTTRERQATEGTESAVRAHDGAQPPPPGGAEAAAAAAGSIRRVVRGEGEGEGAFKCRTCSRRFPSFQALGGHRTGHTRLVARHALPRQPADRGRRKARAHGCAVCGLEFPMGQALGGHMRRHKGDARVVKEEEEHHHHHHHHHPEMPDLNHPPLLEDRGGDREERPSGSEPRLLNLLV